MEENRYVKFFYIGTEQEALKREINLFPITLESTEETQIEIKYADQSGMDRNRIMIKPKMGKLEKYLSIDPRISINDKGNLWDFYWGEKQVTVYKTK